MLKKLRLLTLILAVCLLSAQLTFADAMVFYNNDHRVCYWVTVSASDGGCNFRYGPGVEYDKIFSRMIPNGTLLSVDRQADAANGKPWGYVQYNGRYGWIALSQVSLAYIPAGESAPSFFFRSMPSGSFTILSEVHPPKAKSVMQVTFGGIIIFVSEEPPPKAESRMCTIL